MKRILAPMFLAVCLLTGVAQACPMCKESISNTSEGGTGAGWGGPAGVSGDSAAGLSAGFNLSVYTMFAGLAGTMGIVGRTIYKGVKSSPQ